MRRRLRTELIRSTVVTTTVTLVIFMAGTLIHLRYGMKDTMDRLLRDIGPDILAQLSDREAALSGDGLPVFLTLFDERNLIRLLEAGSGTGGSIYTNPRYLGLLEDYRAELEEEVEAGREPEPLRTLWHEGRSFRVGDFREGSLRVILAADLGGLERPLMQILVAFIFALPIAAATAALVSLWQARRVSDPIERLAAHAGQLTASHLDRRVSVAEAPLEVYELGEVFNRMTDRLERSFTQARRFSADASHELRSPLTVMQGILENHLQEGSPAELAHDDAVRMLEATQRLKAIVEGLLVLAKADEGSLLQERQSVDMASLLDEIAADAQVMAEVRGARFRGDWRSIPTVSGDAPLLGILLHNLLKNAVQHCPSGGEVSLQARKTGRDLEIRVFNSGPPIPETDRERIFERFVRLDTEHPGIGLGLNLAREIARAHGGELDLVFSDDRGSEFRARLPVA